MDDESENIAEDAALRAWLTDLREAAQLTKGQAGEAIGASNREIRRWENENAPGGINLLRLLSAYGVRFDPPPPDAIPGAVNAELQALRVTLEDLAARLERLEGRAERQGRATTASLRALAVAVERIEQRLDAQDPPANRRPA